MRVALSIWFPAAAASFSAARVVLLVLHTCAAEPTHGSKEGGVAVGFG